MKKVLITLVIAIFAMTVTFAQADAKKNATKVAKFEADKTLSKADVAFLAVISNGPDKARGAAATEVMVGKSKYKVGQKLTKADADALNAKASSYGKAQKDPDAKVRGSVCYYLYCDGYGNCYYVYYYC